MPRRSSSSRFIKIVDRSIAGLFVLTLFTTANAYASQWTSLFHQFTFTQPFSSFLNQGPLRDMLLEQPVDRQVVKETRDQAGMEEAPSHAAAPKPPQRTDNRRGVYMTGSSAAKDEFFTQTLDAVEQNGGNSIVFDVKGSFVYFPSTSSLAADLDLVRPLYELPELVRKAQERGFYVIARYIAVKDAVFSGRNPEVRIRHPQTNVAVGNVWVDPAHPTTLEYNRQVLRDVASSGIDEINLDYIRYPTEYGQWQIGLSGQEKADRLEKFVRMARETIDEYGPDTKLGVSTYAILGWNYPVNLEPLGQDFVRFAPMLDVISPMAYPQTFSVGAYYTPGRNPGSRDYYLVYRTLTGYRELLGEEHAKKVRPWIQGYYMTNQRVKDQIQAVYDAGHCGFQFWNANNNYGPVYAGMGASEVPERCHTDASMPEVLPRPRWEPAPDPEPVAEVEPAVEAPTL